MVRLGEKNKCCCCCSLEMGIKCLGGYLIFETVGLALESILNPLLGKYVGVV